MDDRRIRETLTAMLTNLDPDAEYALRHDEFVADIPQSRERIRGRDNMRAMQVAFPPDRAPRFQVRRITGGGDVWTHVEAERDDMPAERVVEGPAGEGPVPRHDAHHRRRGASSHLHPSDRQPSWPSPPEVAIEQPIVLAPPGSS